MKPAVPGLEAVFTVAAEIGASRSGGPSPNGERLHIEITGGSVEGPRLRGRILPGGSDWPLIRPDGTSRIGAIYTILADDGTPILVRNEGIRASPPELTARLRAGEPVDPSEYYFRCVPVFEAPAGPHGWLNDAVFVGSVCRSGGTVLIDVYLVR